MEKVIQAQLQAIGDVTDMKITIVVQELSVNLSFLVTQSQEQVIQR